MCLCVRARVCVCACSSLHIWRSEVHSFIQPNVSKGSNSGWQDWQQAPLPPWPMVPVQGGKGACCQYLKLIFWSLLLKPTWSIQIPSTFRGMYFQKNVLSYTEESLKGGMTAMTRIIISSAKQVLSTRWRDKGVRTLTKVILVFSLAFIWVDADWPAILALPVIHGFF